MMHLRRLTLALLAVLLLAPAAAFAHDPVLLERGATRERLSDVLVRFEIAVRGLIARQGMPFSAAAVEQFYPFLGQFLDQRASELALLGAAAGRGLTLDPDVVDAELASIRARFPDEATFVQALADAGFRDVATLAMLIGETETINLLIADLAASIVIGDDELQVAYAALAPQITQPDRVCARHILVDDEAGAAALSRAVRAGADFAAMAATASTDRGSATRGGDLGCFERGVMVTEFETAAFGAAIGEATEPVRSAFGYHVILVERRIPGGAPALDEIREPLLAQIRDERVQASIEALIAYGGVRSYPDRIPPFAEAYPPTE
jgi:peptidyl-prolyl cis-trans isomerase C